MKRERGRDEERERKGEMKREKGRDEERERERWREKGREVKYEICSVVD